MREGSIMEGFFLIIIIALLAFIVFQKIASNRKKSQDTTAKEDARPEPSGEKGPLLIAGAYQRSWLFTYNEKDAYQKLKPIAEGLGYTVFAKVRLLDLVTPL